MNTGGRIRQLRQAKGYSLDELVTRMGGLVTKQALSKYENEKSVPRPTVLVALAKALGVSASDLMREPEYEFEVVAYRALAGLPRRERAEIESRVKVDLEQRLQLMDHLGVSPQYPFASLSFAVNTAGDTEDAALGLRQAWELGTQPIANVADTLEDRGLFLVEVESDRKFDGLAVRARDREGKIVACAVATRREVSRTRQRMDHAHEVGHLVLEPGGSMDAEQVARRFAGAFLFPRDSVIAEFGSRRSRVTADELLIAKRRWGLSMQGVLFRLKDLQILNETSYRWWCMRINQSGWREREPGEEAPETSTWFATHARRAVAEGLISRETFAEYLPAVDRRRYPGDVDRRALMKLPLRERRALMRAQAETIAAEYNAGLDDEWLGGDFEGE